MGVLLFEEFELLDVTGPIEMFGCLPDQINLAFIAEQKGLVTSSQSLAVMAMYDFASAPKLDFLFVPGGKGTRTEVNNSPLLSWINTQALQVELILSVCTGAALLAKAGLLDHHKATSNKLAFDWVKSQGPNTQWIRKARWVDDGKIITSSGVAAGIDMSLYVIARLYGESKRDEVIRQTEYMFNEDPEKDFFA